MPVSQNMTALDRGNLVRNTGARRRRELASVPFPESCALAAEMLRDPPEEIARMRLGVFLTAIRSVSDASAARLIRRASLTRGMWNRRIGPVELYHPELTLTAHQREAVAKVLRG